MIQRTNACYGCGLCAAVCPTSALKIELNVDGFYRPVANESETCVNCQLCDICCPFGDTKVALPESAVSPKSYAAWSLNPDTRFQCSSGGIAFEICSQLLKKDYVVCGVVYDATERLAKHVVVRDIDSLTATIGSKYIQSYTKDAFEQLKKPGRYVVVGAPCQIDAIRRYIKKTRREGDFILIDFFCHGVPSKNLWEKYLQREEKTHQSQAIDIAWRNKASGWHDAFNMTLKYQTLTGETVVFESKKSQGDLFYWFFLGNFCLNPCCYDHCKYKSTDSAADIRIGDLWGKAFKNEEAGVSGVLALSAKGDKVLSELENCHLKQEKIELVLDGQMFRGARRPYGYSYVHNALKTDVPLDKIAKIGRRINFIFTLHKKIFRRLSKIVFKKG